MVDYRDARGWLSEAEREFLVEAGKEVHATAIKTPADAVILEVGAEFGASTVCLRTGAGIHPTIMSLDIWPNDLLQVHRTEVAKAEYRQRWVAKMAIDQGADPNRNNLQIVGDSKLWGPLWRQELDLLFIDGDHRYEGAYSDAWHFTKHLKMGKLVIFHDCLGDHPIHRQTNAAVTDWAEEPAQGRWVELDPVDTMRVFKREAKW